MSTDFAVEFLIWVLIAASIIAVVAARLRIPYTVALVLGGLALGLIRLPIVETLVAHKPDWLTPSVTLVVFLPALLFEGSLKLQVRRLRENALPILLLATVGVLTATLVTGFAAHWVLGLPVLVALIFGAITAATDPISVLSIFKEMAIPQRLSVVVEGESLFNDGTAAVLYGILVAGVASGRLGIWGGVQDFLIEVLGGIALGGAMGYVFSKLTQQIDDPQIEITLTTVLAYSSYLLARSVHVSGVIATVAAGITVGNLGTRIGMSPRTRIALWSFWEYFSFVVNSLVFLLIGLQVRVGMLLDTWRPTLLAIGTVILGRVLSVYGLVPLGNFFSVKIPLRWQHILVAGGIRGALSLALALSLAHDFPYRQQLLAMTFGVVAVTIVFQGLAIKPLLRALGMSAVLEDDYERARVQQIAISSARSELDDLFRNHVLSGPAYDRLRGELDGRLAHAKAQVVELYEKDETRIASEIGMAKMKLIAAEKSSIEEAVHAGLITQQTADKMIEAADQELDKLSGRDT
ncbi:MAG TPA: Na+/H+ antiporter [Candidatus Angelobacter sp.]|nr:Na+/H+ antiporter [Candidatus Angelobacter sp.]